MFTRVLIGLLGSLLIYGGIRIVLDGETDSFVQYVGNVKDWRSNIEGLAWTMLGFGLIVRFSVSRQWQTEKHYRKYLYEIPFAGSALGYCVAVIGSLFIMFT